ncbi:CASC4 protein, partial [Amia calva]|nr:CASC4 protein [Amia calva]
MVGFGANRRGGRLPSFILIALLVVILILSFNYWTVSSKHSRLLDELAEVQAQVKRTDAARSRLEKRNSELSVQVDTHRKQMDKKDSDFNTLDSKLQARDSQIKKLTDEKNKLQADLATQMSEVQRLQEQLTELRQEFLKQEDHLHETKKNNTYLEKKLEYESLQCGRQIAELKDEYEERMKSAVEEAADLKRVKTRRCWGVVWTWEDIPAPLPSSTPHTDPYCTYWELDLAASPAVLPVPSHHLLLRLSSQEKTGIIPGAEQASKEKTGKAGNDANAAADHQTEATRKLDGTELKDLAKHGSDAGMPGIEDSEVGKVEDLAFALRKPAITQNKLEGGGGGEVLQDRAALVGAHDSGPNVLHRDANAEHSPELQRRGPIPLDPQQQLPKPEADKPRAIDANKMVIRAEELGEQQRQLKGGGKSSGAEGLIPAPLQKHPRPCQSRSTFLCRNGTVLIVRLSAVCLPCRFFDENESPVDPQHGSKLADYNGDDGNVGEYEADKQAELAYNEEEDGDGGEEDVQGELGPLRLHATASPCHCVSMPLRLARCALELSAALFLAALLCVSAEKGDRRIWVGGRGLPF